MWNLPVHWSEGMFLRPHHFQAAERHWSEVSQKSDKWDHHYNYGLRSIELSREALANYQVQITACQARLKDGTLISLEPGQEPDRVDLKGSISEVSQLRSRVDPLDLTQAFQEEAWVRVYLAVPKLQMGQPNVALNGGPHDCRFSETVIPLEEESQGGDRQEIALRRLNVRLLLSTQDTSGYEVLPIAQIARAGERAAAPRLDDSYIPPVLAVDAWADLRINYVRAIYDLIGQKIHLLSEIAIDRGIEFSSQEPGDLERLLKLLILNGAYAKLHCLTFASGVHPFTAYTELCQIVGEISVFDPSRRVSEELPAYDHDDLARIFRWIKIEFQRLLDRWVEDGFEQRFFVGTENMGMEVALDSKWFHGDWKWFVGVKPTHITPQQCEALLTAAQDDRTRGSGIIMPGVMDPRIEKLDWKFGAKSKVQDIYEKRMAGLNLIKPPQVPAVLPTRAGWLFYQVSRDGQYWRDVQAEQTLGMRFNVKLIQNLVTLPGQRDLEVKTGQVHGVLQFALFAVPNKL